MTFDELCTEVQIIVKRPDLAERIQSAVRAATEKLHSLDFYYRDLIEVPVEFDREFCIQNFIPKEIVPRFRKAKYIRFWNGGVDGAAGVFLKAIQIEDAIDSYGYEKVNVFYMAGNMLQIRTNPAVLRVLFGAYIYPTVTPVASYSSWIAEDYPWGIVYEASRTIFRSISMAEEAASYERLTAEIVSEMKTSCVDDIPVT
jgi:hypothetical protein